MRNKGPYRSFAFAFVELFLSKHMPQSLYAGNGLVVTHTGWLNSDCMAKTGAKGQSTESKLQTDEDVDRNQKATGRSGFQVSIPRFQHFRHTVILVISDAHNGSGY